MTMQTFNGSSDSYPPLEDSYRSLVCRSGGGDDAAWQDDEMITTVECELPVVDLRHLRSGRGEERRSCVQAMAKASMEWGFFQVVNHGIGRALLEEMGREQVKLFSLPFEKKACSGILNGSYRWGTPTATSAQQLSWSEAFHVPLAKISCEDYSHDQELSSLREAMRKLGAAMAELASTLAGALAESMGYGGCGFPGECDERTCFLRLNRYPPCPFSPGTFGLVPHTDSDFLTILHQDHVGGLQLMKDSKWAAVKPNADALVVNIGDLFQAWSNGVYRSVEHKVMANGKEERYSIAYFLCPSYNATIRSCTQPYIYRTFTFGEFREQVQEDVKKFGRKVGLPRFLL